MCRGECAFYNFLFFACSHLRAWRLTRCFRWALFWATYPCYNTCKRGHESRIALSMTFVCSTYLFVTFPCKHDGGIFHAHNTVMIYLISLIFNRSTQLLSLRCMYPTVHRVWYKLRCCDKLRRYLSHKIREISLFSDSHSKSLTSNQTKSAFGASTK